MTDFIIVIATAAMLAAPTPAPGASAATIPGAAAAASVPLSAPTVGFRTYSDAASCEQATASQVAPPGMRLVCLPIDALVGEFPNAY